MAANALNRHLALAGFMGAGKTTLGEEVARRLRRRFVDLDHQIERQAGATIEELFARDGEPGFRVIEERVAASVLEGAEPAVIALGGGTVLSEPTRAILQRRAFTVLLDIDPRPPGRGRARAGGRSRSTSRRSTRSTARGSRSTRTLRMRAPATSDGVVLAAAGIDVRIGALDLLDELVPGDGPVEIVADANVAGIHGVTAQLALGNRDVASHEVPPGEQAKTLAVLERLWRALRIGRDGTIVGLGGGCTTDLAGFAAATYMRGVPWVAVPTTLVGQVDAAIGGKTAIDLPGGKNLVGAFHWPARVVIDPALLETLPAARARERHGRGREDRAADGAAASGSSRSPSSCAAAPSFKAAVCLADPHDRGARNQLNLGHTFAHALEAAAGYDAAARATQSRSAWSPRCGCRGATPALEIVERVARPASRFASIAKPPGQRCAVTRRRSAGAPRLVLLERAGEPTWGNEVPAADVRAALDASSPADHRG